MNGLPEQIDLSFLEGRELIQVCVGMFQVIFGFDDQVSISVEGCYSVHSEAGESTWKSGEKPRSDVLNLLGANVAHVRGEADGTLTLTFSEDLSLVIFDSSKEYESYQIAKPGTIIVV